VYSSLAMAKRAAKRKEWKPIHRLAFAFIGLMLIGSGSLTLLSGKLHYRNYWHAPVFAPFAILVGMIAIAVAFALRNKEK
jgi:Ni,Fe-hydrogenase I cytochrome b subunit